MKEFEHEIPAVLNKPAILPSDLISQRIIELEKTVHERIDKLEARIKELESKDIDTKQWVR